MGVCDLCWPARTAPLACHYHCLQGDGASGQEVAWEACLVTAVGIFMAKQSYRALAAAAA